MELRLDDEQAEELRELLATAISDLGPEITHTDNAHYRAALTQRRTVLRAIEAQLDAVRST